MADSTTCPHCGEESSDPQWCDHCGTPLSSGELSFFSEGEELSVTDGDLILSLKSVETIESFATRRVTLGEVTAVEGTDEVEKGDLLLIEERLGELDRPYKIPEAVRHLFRQPIATEHSDDRLVSVFEDTNGLNLHDLLEIANGRLSFTQIIDIFSTICNSVAQAHSLGYLVLALSPWTVRVEGGNIETRVARITGNHTMPELDSDLLADEAPTVQPSEDGDELGGVQSEASEFEVEATQSDLPRLPSIEEISEGIDTEDGNETIGPLSGNVPNPEPVFENLVATFEGIDFLVGIDDSPEEVPVVLGFSAPEFFGPYASDIGPVCDIFGLGMLLYFLASGRVPPTSLYTRHTPAVGFRAFRPGFPPGLQTVISKATHPLPEARYATVEEMSDDFERAIRKMKERVSLNDDEVDPPRAAVSVDTHIGIVKRLRNPTNQDAVFAEMSDDQLFGLVVVADGVSTADYGTGDLASHFLRDAAERIWEDLLPKYLIDEPVDEVRAISDLLADANQCVVDYVNEHFSPFEGSPHQVMGSTALIAIFHRGVVTLGSLGDSRVYMHNEFGLEQLTVDHNLWTLSVLEGIPADSAMAMPHGEALARCLGTFRIEEGILNSIRPEPDYFRFVITPGDTLLMTTDGLTDFAGSSPFDSVRNIELTMNSESNPALA